VTRVGVPDSETLPAREPSDIAAPPPRARPPRPRLRGGWFTTVCAVVGLAVGALGLFWDFVPQYRPDPLDTVGADVAVAALEPGITLLDFLRRTHPDDVAGAGREVFGRAPSPSELRQPGEMLYVRTQVDGHKHRDIALRYTVYEGRAQTPVDLPLPPELKRLQRTELIAPSQRSVQLLWVPDLSDEPDVFIRVELTSDSGLLAMADSGRLRHGLLRR
jgi:hypothetical protein